MTPRKPESEKKRPGRPRKPVGDTFAVSVPVRLTLADGERLDAITDNRTDFCRKAVLAALGRAEKKRARS